MKFNENKYIEIPYVSEVLVYLLVDKDNEVVYVGKTESGLFRPYKHKKDKEFYKVMVIPCEPEKLDETEDYFIMKYKPKYNKIVNTNEHYGINKAKAMLTEILGYKPTRPFIDKLLIKNGLWYESGDEIGYVSINRKDFEIICESLKNGDGLSGQKR